MFLALISPCRADSRPNILWISAEDLSPDLGCYGDSYARTPNLDRFAAESARFTRAFAVTPVCAPSRSSIITGLYPTTIGTLHMRSKAVPPPYVKCFTEYLRERGYYCTNNVKTDYNFDSPLTAWDESSNRAHWRNRPDKRQPFFAVFNLTVTHESQIRAEKEAFERQTRSLIPEERHDPAKAAIPPYYPDTTIVRRDWANYYDLITAMDKQAAGILRQLDEDGLAENTVVFFWGDHGRGLPRAKRWVYDSGTRVPLMVRWPGKIQAGSVQNDLVCLMDLGPTVLSIAGTRPPEHMQRRAFLGEHAGKPREYVFAHRDRMDEAYDIIRSIRDTRFRYIRNFQPGKPYAQYIDYMELMPTMKEMRRLNKEEATLYGAGQRPALLTPAQRLFFRPEKPKEELYDTDADPHEVDNLAESATHKEVLIRMRGILDRHMKETNDLGLIKESDLQERMRPGGIWQQTARPEIRLSPGGFNSELTITCATEGASLAYTTEEGPNPRWYLYTHPVYVPPASTIRAKACRLGYKDSEEARSR